MGVPLTSGRESLPIEDRIGLLSYDRMWLASLPGNGMEIHDRNNLLEVIAILSYCWNKQNLRHIVDNEILYAEVMVMAWRRGGHQEYKRVKELTVK